ncbi:MAG TPA: hypothetical protein VI916_06110 [Acidimicrobiia bacterium]|nr:hypothetical protein [Acidimicrobiia bacterium]
MASSPHVVLSNTFPAEIRPEMATIVCEGFDGVLADDVEVHVKARARVERRYVMEFTRRGRLTRWAYARKRDAHADARRYRGEVTVETRRSPRAGDWSGRAYDGVPDISRVAPGVAYLVTMNIPADPRRLTRYPLTHQDPRLKTSPEILFECWQDELFHVAAHEARHIHQFRHELRRSELDAERWAFAAIEARRAARQPLTLFDLDALTVAPAPAPDLGAATSPSPSPDHTLEPVEAQARVRDLLSALAGSTASRSTAGAPAR